MYIMYVHVLPVVCVYLTVDDMVYMHDFNCPYAFFLHGTLIQWKVESDSSNPMEDAWSLTCTYSMEFTNSTYGSD